MRDDNLAPLTRLDAPMTRGRNDAPPRTIESNPLPCPAESFPRKAGSRDPEGGEGSGDGREFPKMLDRGGQGRAGPPGRIEGHPMAPLLLHPGHFIWQNTGSLVVCNIKCATERCDHNNYTNWFGRMSPREGRPLAAASLPFWSSVENQ